MVATIFFNITIFAQPGVVRSSGLPALGSARLYYTATGDLFESQPAQLAGSGPTKQSVPEPHLYIGYGENTGSVNNAFSLYDFLLGVEVAEMAIFKRWLSEAEMKSKCSSIFIEFDSGISIPIT